MLRLEKEKIAYKSEERVVCRLLILVILGGLSCACSNKETYARDS